MEIYPEGLLEALKAMKKYGKPLYMTENGVAYERDPLSPSFITEHVKVGKALGVEKIDVTWPQWSRKNITSTYSLLR